MPHKCTKCGRIYQNGDKQVLYGCVCGNRKFEYIPAAAQGRKDEMDKISKLEKEKIVYKVLKRETEGEKIESVRIISPGCYEINLEKIMSRREIIIALGEEGVYLIHFPSILKTNKI